MSDNNKSSPVVKYLKRATEIGQEEFQLPGTVKFKIVPVSVQLIQDIEAMIKEPSPPMWENPEKGGRPEANPSDPAYLAALTEVRRQRNSAAMDAMIMMGIDLIDGMPEDDAWLDRLRNLERRGLLSLDGYDLDDPIDREFLYKRLVISNGEVFELISRASGVTEEAIAEAEASFPGN